MSFFKFVGRTLGFGGDDSDQYLDELDATATVTPRSAKSVALPVATSTTTVAVTSSAAVSKPLDPNSNELPIDFIDRIINMVNQAQPEVVKQCLDREAQRRFVYSALGDSFHTYIKQARASIESEVAVRINDVHAEYRTEITNLRERLKALETKESRWNETKLSAERRLRAANEKAHDLQTRVDSLEAEKEQFILENKSLINKLRVVSHLDHDGANAAAADSEEVERLNQEIATLKAENERLNTEVIENAELFKTKMTMSDKMLSDFRSQHADADRTHNQLIADHDALKQLHEATTTEVARLTAELHEATTAISNINVEVEQRMAQIEEVHTRQEEKIKSLKEQLKEKALEIEVMTAKLAEKAEPEAKTDVAVADPEAIAADVQSKRRRGRPRQLDATSPQISAIDQTLESTEWLVATPPEGKSLKQSSSGTDAEFGYQEPSKKPIRHDDAQMTLF